MDKKGNYSPDWFCFFFSDVLINRVTGITFCFREQDGAVTHWKVKNSWGKERGQNGYVSMHANYLEQYVEQAVINKTYLPKGVQAVFEREPRAVRYWG